MSAPRNDESRAGSGPAMDRATTAARPSAVGPAVSHTPEPWAIVPDCYDGKEEAWCHWHKVGPLILSGKEPTADGLRALACVNACAGLDPVCRCLVLVSARNDLPFSLRSALALADHVRTLHPVEAYPGFGISAGGGR